MSTFAMVLLASSAAVALADPDAIMSCRKAHEEDPPAHIECLEQALRARSAISAHEPAAAAPDFSALPARAAVAAAPAAATAAPAAVAIAVPSASPPPTGLGAEQAQAQTRQRAEEPPAAQAATVQIVTATYNAAGLGTFTMADGQVWQETERTPSQLRLQPGGEYAARIERGKVGGYRLYVDGANWMYKVKRLR
jgi:hypothetical protein